MADRNTPWKDGEIIVLGVAADAVIDAGNLVAVNASGYAVPASDSAGLMVIGIADEQVDNTGGTDGSLIINVRRNKLVALENSATNPVTTAQIGKKVYVEDSVTVSANKGTNAIVAGICLGVDDDGVWVVPGQNIGAPVADSAAADLATMVADFNNLLAVLRSAGVIAE